MNVTIMSEHGYAEAAEGFSLSYNTSIERAMTLLPLYAHKGGGESKFLESIVIWMNVNFSRSVWAEADTYRISTKQSESTMHTLAKRYAVQSDFEYPIPEDMLYHLNKTIDLYRDKKIGIEQLKNVLPEGFLQRRIWVVSYKTFQNIYQQRINHRMPQWRQFLEVSLVQLEHPEFIVKPLTNKE